VVAQAGESGGAPAGRAVNQTRKRFDWASALAEANAVSRWSASEATKHLGNMAILSNPLSTTEGTSKGT
jgi:hypothetical protein